MLLVVPAPPLRQAARSSGLPVRQPVRIATVSPARYDAARRRDYPRALRDAQAVLAERLGLRGRTAQAAAPAAWYDAVTRRLLVRRGSAPSRGVVLHELVRALIDQNFNLRRLRGLATRDHDRAAAAYATVDGVAALTSRRAVGPGRDLARELQQVGGRAAVNSALRTFPQTTEQLLHIDKFLERERALPLSLPARAGGDRLGFSETYGELDVRNLLEAFGVPGAADAAAGWAAGRAALYGENAVLVLRWDSLADALEWREAVGHYVASAFPGSSARDCPPLDRCWQGVAAGVLGPASVLATGPSAASVATAILGGL